MSSNSTWRSTGCTERETVVRSFSIFLVWQELAAEGQLDAVALRIGLALDRHIEIDGAHHAVAELLLDQLLPGGALDLHQLVEAVDQGVGRNRARPDGR